MREGKIVAQRDFLRALRGSSQCPQRLKALELFFRKLQKKLLTAEFAENSRRRDRGAEHFSPLPSRLLSTLQILPQVRLNFLRQS